jgi:hypothetical protein
MKSRGHLDESLETDSASRLGLDSPAFFPRFMGLEKCTRVEEKGSAAEGVAESLG